MDKKYNIFISHSWKYDSHYKDLLELLKKDTSFEFCDFSVPINDPIHNANNDRELYEAIKRQMSPSSIVIIMAGVYSTYSKWINHEINIAKKEFYNPKKIIAVEGWGVERTSKIVKENADKTVKWQSSSIINAIKELAN
jgi:hypothetical protein